MDTTNRPPLNLRGHRFKPLNWDTMTSGQAAMAHSVLAGKRCALQGPCNVLRHSPKLGNLAQQFGAHTRFNSSLPLALNGLAGMLTSTRCPKAPWRSSNRWTQIHPEPRQAAPGCVAAWRVLLLECAA